MINEESLYKYINTQWEKSIIPSLCEYIKIPNKSPHFDKDWEKNNHMMQAAHLMRKWCESNNLNNFTIDIIKEEGKTPLIFIEILGEIDKTILLYGHLDKQPEMQGWREDLNPWAPKLINGKLYGRGGADDGYAVYSAITAIKALQVQNLKHPRCVILIEGSEESGSEDLPYYIDKERERIGAPSLIICLDSGAGNYEQLWVTTSLRGNIVGELSVSLLREGIHSGYGSGIAADSFRVARTLLSRIEDEETGDLKLDELKCQIPENRIKECTEQAESLGKSIYEALPFHDNVSPLSKSLTQLLLHRTWQPSLSITGASGLPNLQDAGNVLRPNTILKLSIRIPPLVDPDIAATALKKALTYAPPYNAQVNFKILDKASGWEAPKLQDDLLKIYNDASIAFFQKPVMFTGEGGSIPFMSMLGKFYPKAQFMIVGVLGPNSNAHGPNEFLHIEMAKRITSCISYVIAHFK